MFYLFQFIRFLITFYTFILLARVLLPMLGVSYAHPVMRFLYNVTEPLLAPIRKRLPQTGPLDFSPMVLIFALWLIEMILAWVLLRG